MERHCVTLRRDAHHKEELMCSVERISIWLLMYAVYRNRHHFYARNYKRSSSARVALVVKVLCLVALTYVLLPEHWELYTM